MKITLFSIVFLIGLCFFSCTKNSTSKKVGITKIKFKHEGNLNILDSTKTTIKKLQIEIADNDFERQTGLMYRKQMDNNKAMLFIFNDDDVRVRSFYMKNTYIPLDIIFIDENKTIINIAKHTKPLDENSVFSDAPAKYVLEINAGLSDFWRVKAGNHINFTSL